MPDVVPRTYAIGERVLVEIIVRDTHDSGNILCHLGDEAIRPSLEDLRTCEVTRDRAAEGVRFAEVQAP